MLARIVFFHLHHTFNSLIPLFLAVLEFELGILHSLGRRSTTWAMPLPPLLHFFMCKRMSFANSRVIIIIIKAINIYISFNSVPGIHMAFLCTLAHAVLIGTLMK
jgi:hypothetical protein